MPDRSKDKIDISYIAKRLGMASSTVSKALNNRPGASAATRAKVERLVKELDYSPNHFAKALKTNRSDSIAFVMPEMDHEFFTDIARSISREAKLHGCHALFCSSDNSPEEEVSLVKDIFNRHVDGLILVPCVNCDPAGLQDAINGRPCVVVDNFVKELDAPFVGTDFREGLRMATARLISSGHRKIGLLLGPEGLYSTPERLDGYRSALLDAKIAFDSGLVESGAYTVEAGISGVKEILARRPETTAMVCSNAIQSKGAARGLDALGLKIPADISLVEFGGLRFTSVDQRCDEIGRVAAHTLFQVIDGGFSTDKTIIRPELFERGSVASPKQGAKT